MERLEDDWFTPIIEILTIRREIMGITQEDLNFRIGCADNHLSKWEAGMFKPSLYYFILWCEALDYRLILRPQS